MVDQRVGFFLDGGSSVWTRGSPPLNGPLMVSRAGSLLRRTWRGISERQERQHECYSNILWFWIVIVVRKKSGKEPY